MMKKYRESYIPLLICAIVFLIIYFVGIKIPEETIKKIISDSGQFGVLILIFLFWISNFFAPLSGSPFLFVGFYLYGQTVVIYAFIAAVIASVTNFWVAKIWGRSLVRRIVGKDELEKIDNLTINYGLPTLFVLRLFLKEFHDVISYAFGLTKIKFARYFAVSTLGMIPPTIIWYLISFRIKNALSFTIISWLIAYVFLTVYVVWIAISTKKIPKLFLKSNRYRAEKFVDRILPWIKNSNRMIDIGCGSGFISQVLAEKGKNITLIDIVDKSFTKDVKPLIYDGKRIPFADKNFDVGLLSTVLHHTPNPESVFQEAGRVAKELIIVETSYKTSLGKIIIVLFDSFVNFQLKPFWNSYKSDPEWRKLFNKYDWQVKSFNEYTDKNMGISYLHLFYHLTQK